MNAGERFLQELAAEDADLEVRGEGAVDLACGHWTRAGYVVAFSGGRRLYDCPKGCGLQDRRVPS